jgi:hypothetical protein
LDAKIVDFGGTDELADEGEKLQMRRLLSMENQPGRLDSLPDDRRPARRRTFPSSRHWSHKNKSEAAVTDSPTR